MKITKDKKVNIITSIVLIIICLVSFIFLELNKYEYNYVISIIEKSLIYSVVALSMNMIVGFTGLFSLGQAGFMAIGAYITSIFIIPIESRPNVYYVKGISPLISNIQIPVPMALLLGGLCAALLAFLIGIPILRLKSDYLAIATLGFSEIVRIFIAAPILDTITNGSYGLKSIPGFNSLIECFIYCSVLIVIMVLIINSSTGRDFKAIREDEIAAEAVGINLFKTKEISFITSSFFTGIGGGLLAIFMRSIDSKTFSITLTYDILLMVVLGGIGSITGSIIGSFLVNAGKEILRFFDEPLSIAGVNIPLFKPGFRMVIFSILLMIVVLFFKKGVIGGREFIPSNIYNFFTKKKKGDIKNE